MNELTKIEGGYIVQANGIPLCAGVICRCNEPGFCPMHGKRAYTLCSQCGATENLITDMGRTLCRNCEAKLYGWK